MARDATARLYDVKEDSVALDQKKGLITFRARKGTLVSLDRLHESLWATRLSGRTGMKLLSLEVTAVGEVDGGKTPILVVRGSEQHFVLLDDSKKEPRERLPLGTKRKRTKDAKSPYARMIQALERGDKVVGVTGVLDGWSGLFPKLLASLPEKPRRIIVTSFEVAGKKKRESK